MLRTSSDARIVCINPNLVLQKNDLFTTGIVFMPFGLAYFSGTLIKEGYNCQVVDAFGENPNQIWKEGDFVFRGLQPLEIVDQIKIGSTETPKVFFIYAINLTYHCATLNIIKQLNNSFPSVPIAVLENTQAVTGYSLEEIQDEFYANGATYVVMGEPEERGVALIKYILSKRKNIACLNIDGIGFLKDDEIIYTPATNKIKNLDSLAFPAWELFPVQNYWKLKYAHGPQTSNKYLPILSSRGCPYSCRFCVIPKTNDLKWRFRTAIHVVDEMEYWLKKWDIKEFHFEDVDPTISDKRIQEMCLEIIRRDLPVRWKICSGTKVETIKSEKTIELMARAGCRYISISPESGSPKIMKLINKPFNYDHALKLIRKMNEVGIFSQTCFILGFPGEEHEDRMLTRKMVFEFTRAGVSEIALFIVTPVPGSDIFDEFSGYKNYSQLNFSPTWRQDYNKINHFRVKLYGEFLWWKLRFHPVSILKQPFNFLLRKFNTKMEMTPYRAMHIALILKGFIGKINQPTNSKK
jgi:anaerobic magnesium-protoporphyrin IX monomethyl ester cyclase